MRALPDLATRLSWGSAPMSFNTIHPVRLAQDRTAHPGGPGRKAGNTLQTQNIALAPRQEIKLPQTRNRGVDRPRIAITRPQTERPRAELRPRIAGTPLKTAGALKESAGRPKNDIDFKLFTCKRSSSYKAFLAQLGYHHDMLNFGDTLGDAEAALGRLEDLRQRATAYVNKSGHSRKNEIRDLLQEIANEKMVFERLRDDLSNGHALPDHMFFTEVLDFVREGVSLQDAGVADRLNLTPAEARDIINEGQFYDLSPEKVSLLRKYINSIEKQSMPPEARKRDFDLQLLQGRGFDQKEAKLLVDAGLGLKEGLLYRAVRLPISADTIVGGMRDSNLTAAPTKAGSGAFNTVYFVQYATPNGPYTGVFKPLPPVTGKDIENGWVADRIGINCKNPQNAMRNLATYDVARQLGFNVVPHTEISIHTPPPPPPKDATLGIVMARAKGKPAGEISPGAFKLPEVRREVTKLQLLDALTGQGDRHRFNYFIHIDDELGATVTGIDNDQCFGKNTHLPDDVAYADRKGKDGFWGVNLPPVVDTEMVAAFDQLTPGGLEATLAGKLTPEEITAAKDRLVAIKGHLSELRKRNAVIEPDGWLFTDKYFNGSGASSYVARDRAIVKDGYVRPPARA